MHKPLVAVACVALPIRSAIAKSPSDAPFPQQGGLGAAPATPTQRWATPTQATLPTDTIDKKCCPQGASGQDRESMLSVSQCSSLGSSFSSAFFDRRSECLAGPGIRGLSKGKPSPDVLAEFFLCVCAHRGETNHCAHTWRTAQVAMSPPAEAQQPSAYTGKVPPSVVSPPQGGLPAASSGYQVSPPQGGLPAAAPWAPDDVASMSVARASLISVLTWFDAEDALAARFLGESEIPYALACALTKYGCVARSPWLLPGGQPENAQGVLPGGSPRMPNV